MQPISEQPICDLFALMEKHMVKMCTSYLHLHLYTAVASDA